VPMCISILDDTRSKTEFCVMLIHRLVRFSIEDFVKIVLDISGGGMTCTANETKLPVIAN